ncbi:YhgE/Pip domain-containing protein [Cytobacillus sp. NCCP-133]|uniref:YhgE/Pip domain-containing protein n=1 Tax=Cytobacillus sp. NCCP-133 TaxID=766848 RepID=UPI00281460FE|nr:YhgE/Pip domain-containing protein [Cytobacillus sp. NCCP-133]GLB59907.1 hypothetical protein NCCP133_20390 [Cytobacillus sp. NCCP-133]
MRKKQVSIAALALMIFLPSILSYAAVSEAEKIEGKLTSKDEVVYATLKADGELDNVYVVNTLDVAKAGEILDYGVYSSVKNLTDLSEISQEGQTIGIDAPEGKFYYQGNLNDDSELPWDIDISYRLNGEPVDPLDLAGKTGHVEIGIQTVANENIDAVFYENYLLQVSLMLPNKYSNIEANGGMIANAGKNKQITFTVMPAQDERLSVEADAEDFEFNGIEIAAVPSTLPIDTSEMGNMTDDMSALSNAIKELKNGAADLKKGAAQLNDGAASLREGSQNYKDGINQVNGSSTQVVNASRSIGEALERISGSLSGNSADMDLMSLSELPNALTQLANGLTETADGLSALRENYTAAYRVLDGAMNEIPAQQITEEEISELYKSGADSNVLDKLVESYSAAQKVKGTYSNVKKAFDAVEPSLTQISDSVRGMSGTLTSIANELSESMKEMDVSALGELQKGLTSLSSNYSQFHSGLVSYTEGVGQLSSSYNKLHSGITELSGGTSELEKGLGELQNGTDKLHEETKDLPAQMQKKINEMVQEYDKSDFKPVSFVSSKNETVSSVQFVIKTESIEKEEQVTKKEKPVKEKGFWDLLLDLFR